jgi:hypothetical protein
MAPLADRILVKPADDEQVSLALMASLLLPFRIGCPYERVLNSQVKTGTSLLVYPSTLSNFKVYEGCEASVRMSLGSLARYQHLQCARNDMLDRKI